ncbi:MAG TPA: nitroreductase family protein, partial [Acidimicrobiales bacterium]
MAATLAQASLETSLSRLNDAGRALLFTEARTANTFSDRPVTGEQLREIYELMKWGPTWSNTLPLRIVYVTTPDGKARLLPHLQPGNVGKATQAPVNAILAVDLDHSGAGRAWLLIVLVSVFDSRVRFPFAGGVG